MWRPVPYSTSIERRHNAQHRHKGGQRRIPVPAAGEADCLGCRSRSRTLSGNVSQSLAGAEQGSPSYASVGVCVCVCVCVGGAPPSSFSFVTIAQRRHRFSPRPSSPLRLPPPRPVLTLSRQAPAVAVLVIDSRPSAHLRLARPANFDAIRSYLSGCSLPSSPALRCWCFVITLCDTSPRGVC